MSSVFHIIVVILQFNLYLITLIALISIILLITAAFYFRNQPVTIPHTSNADAVTGTKLVIGFFHPYCNSGGGGERVLWQTIHALHSLSPLIHCVVYTGDTDATPQQIQQKAIERFNLPPFARPITFIYLHNRRLLSADLYPHLTMLFQSFAALPVAFSALTRFKPHLFFDTTGYPFTYPLASLMFATPVLTYTHYPTISTDMLKLVYDRRPSYNNSARYSTQVGRYVKLAYYLAFTFLYFLAGQCATLVMVNSHWTLSHIKQLWRHKRIHLVYPPCDTNSLQSLPLLKVRSLDEVKRGEVGKKAGYRDDVIVSIGQFRPEKDHPLQLRAFAHFRQTMKGMGRLNLVDHVRLVLIGGVRDKGDETRVEELRRLAQSLDIQSYVDFLINQPFAVLSSHLASSLVFLHSMWNEHFGMGVVEAASAGLLCLAHNSGGPKEDILVDRQGQGRCGLLAEGVEGYSAQLVRVFGTEWKGGEEMERMRRKGREWTSEQFSDQQFEKQVHEVLSRLVTRTLTQLKYK